MNAWRDFNTNAADAASAACSAVQIAMIAGLPYTGPRDTVPTHPTRLEGLDVLVGSTPTDVNA